MSRKVPDGFDRAKAEEQFVAILKRLGAAAEPLGITVAMESLNRSETNFGNTLRDCLRYVNAAGHPRVKLVADLYHMMRENEGPDAILDAGPQSSMSMSPKKPSAPLPASRATTSSLTSPRLRKSASRAACLSSADGKISTPKSPRPGRFQSPDYRRGF